MTDSDTRMVHAANNEQTPTGELVRAGRIGDAARDLPDERVCPVSLELTRRIGAEPGNPPPAQAADGAR